MASTTRPESISALILRHLFEDAKQALDSDDNSVVITVPAYFGMRETQATVEAGTLAGLNVVSTIPEPIAAALHYGCAPGDSVETLLVFDLGGGTFDTSVLRIGAKSIDTVVVDGDRKLGGADWDLRIAQWLTEQFAEQSGCDPADLADHRLPAAGACSRPRQRRSSCPRCRRPRCRSGSAPRP